MVDVGQFLGLRAAKRANRSTPAAAQAGILADSRATRQDAVRFSGRQIAILFITLAAIASVPIFLYPWPPLSDYINHLARMHVIATISSDRDLAQFYQMMLNHGTLNGRRILSRASVDAMTEVHTGDLKAAWLPGEGEGLTWEVVKDPIGTVLLWSKGTYGHGGAFGTHGWVDPAKDLVGVFLVQGGNVDEVKRAAIQMIGASIE